LATAQASEGRVTAELERERKAHGMTGQELTVELDAERKAHGVTREGMAALNTELATVKARTQAQASVQADQAERLKRTEAEIAEARAATAGAREEAAQLRGQAEAMKAQQAELLAVLKDREGERPRGGKNK
jgi:chromosome segregation ATPase